MKKGPTPEISIEVLEEGCYYLNSLGLDSEKIAAHFEVDKGQVHQLISSYRAKLKAGKVAEGDFDRVFWSDVMKEAEGDVKLTFVSEKGFHHAWKSELASLDGRGLMSIYESTRDFLALDPNTRFLDFPPPKGYDPLILDRELRKAQMVIEGLIGEAFSNLSNQKDEGHNPGQSEAKRA